MSEFKGTKGKWKSYLHDIDHCNSSPSFVITGSNENTVCSVYLDSSITREVFEHSSTDRLQLNGVVGKA